MHLIPWQFPQLKVTPNIDPKIFQSEKLGLGPPTTRMARLILGHPYAGLASHDAGHLARKHNSGFRATSSKLPTRATTPRQTAAKRPTFSALY